MTVIVQYEPAIADWLGDDSGRIFTFPWESIGPQAIEVWAEKPDPDVMGDYIRQKIPPQYYALVLQGVAPLYTSGFIQIARNVVKDEVTRISIVRNTPIFQLEDQRQTAAYPIRSIVFACDKLTMIIQELADRKCNAGIVGDITQEIALEPYEVLTADILDFMINKLTDYCVQMVANGDDCSNDLPGTGANYDDDTNEDTDKGLLGFGYAAWYFG